MKSVLDNAFLNIFSLNIYSAVLVSNFGVVYNILIIISANSSNTVIINLTLEIIKANKIKKKILFRI